MKKKFKVYLRVFKGEDRNPYETENIDREPTPLERLQLEVWSLERDALKPRSFNFMTSSFGEGDIEKYKVFTLDRDMPLSEIKFLYYIYQRWTLRMNGLSFFEEDVWRQYLDIKPEIKEIE